MPNGLKVVLCFLLYLRAYGLEFDLRVFRGMFICKSVESWFYFSRRFPDKEFNHALSIPSFTKNWKGRFLFVKRVGLPEVVRWKTGITDNSRPSSRFCDEASRLLHLPLAVDW